MAVPARLKRIAALFAASPPQIKIEALVDYAERLPPLPEDFERSRMEEITECQSPFAFAVDLDDDTAVHMYFASPREAPTTRGYAAILAEGLNGLPAAEVLAVPDDFHLSLGLGDVVTPLRLRGMGAILARVKRQIRHRLATRSEGAS
jgi:cysteine desulfuration protein SufE